LIEYNTIDSTGFIGIRFLGSNTIIQNNYVNHYCLTLRNGAGIYTYNGSTSATRSGIQILNNIVLNASVRNDGIFCDNRANGVLIQGNTVAFTQNGIYLH